MKTCVSLIKAITSIKDFNIALEHITIPRADGPPAN